MKRLLNAISFALLCVIPFSIIVVLGSALGVLLATVVHGSMLYLFGTLAAISFVVIATLYYKMNP